MTLYKRLEQRLWNKVGTRILQIGMGLAIMYRLVTEFRYAPFFFGPRGAIVGSATEIYGEALGGLIDALFANNVSVYIVLGVWLIAAMGLVLGYATRPATLLALLVYLVMDTRTNIHDGGDNIARIVLFYMLFFHDGLAASDRIKPGVRVFLHNLAVVAVCLQLVALYMVSSTLKLQGDVWVNGTALYYVTHVGWFAPPHGWMQAMFRNPWVVTLSSYGAIIYQLGFSFMLFNRFHLLWVVLGIGFHLGIAYIMGLIPFSLVMMSLVLATIRDSEWLALRAAWQRVRPQTTVYIDGYCAYCRMTGRWIRRLDWLNVFHVTSFRHDDDYKRYGITAEAAEARMHVVSQQAKGSQVYAGFPAVQAVVRFLPPLWPLAPLLWVIGRVGWGDSLYKKLSDSRVIIPDGRHCTAQFCTMQPEANDRNATM